MLLKNRCFIPFPPRSLRAKTWWEGRDGITPQKETVFAFVWHCIASHHSIVATGCLHYWGILGCNLKVEKKRNEGEQKSNGVLTPCSLNARWQYLSLGTSFGVPQGVEQSKCRCAQDQKQFSQKKREKAKQQLRRQHDAEQLHHHHHLP